METTTKFIGVSKNYIGFYQKSRSQFDQKSVQPSQQNSLRPFYSKELNQTYGACESNSISRFIEHGESSQSLEFYFKGKEEVSNILQKIQQIKLIIKKSKRIIFDTLENPRNQTNQITSQITNLKEKIEKTGNLILENGKLSQIDKPPKFKQLIVSIQNQLLLQIHQLKQQISQISEEILIDYKHKQEQNLDSSSFDFINNSINENLTSVFNDSGMQVIIKDLPLNQSSQEIEQINRNALGLSKVIQQINEMSNNQGCMVDRIDCNISITLDRTKKTKEDLMISKKLTERNLGDKMIRLLIFMNIVVLLLVMLKYRK